MAIVPPPGTKSPMIVPKPATVSTSSTSAPKAPIILPPDSLSGQESTAQMILLYGSTDMGKTTQLGRIAKYLWETHGWHGRLVSADSGWAPIAKLVRSEQNPDGPIEAFNLSTTPDVLETLTAIAMGYWPKLRRGTNGQLEAGIYSTPPERWKQVRYYLLEGFSAFADLLMAQMIAEKRKVAEDVVGSYVKTVRVVDGQALNLEFGQAGRAHYNHIHGVLFTRLLPKFRSLPVEYVVFTAHEAKGSDDVNDRLTVLGPASVGKAIVGRTTEKFAHAFHLDKDFIAPDKPTQPTKELFKAYFKAHPEPSMPKASWPAKVSLELEDTEELLKLYPGNFIPLGKNSKGDWEGMEKFIQFLEARKIVHYAIGPKEPQSPGPV